MCTHPDLQGDELIVDHDLLGEEISTDGGLVLIAEALVHVLVHQRGLAHTGGGEKRGHKTKREVEVSERRKRKGLLVFEAGSFEDAH